MNNTIQQMIFSFDEEKDFYGSVSIEQIKNIENYRKLGLREDLIILEDLGEFVMCSETGSKEHIFYWDSVQKLESFRYQNFDDYLEDTFREAISNW